MPAITVYCQDGEKLISEQFLVHMMDLIPYVLHSWLPAFLQYSY